MKKYLALLKWAISKTPATALAVLKALNFSNWRVSLDNGDAEGFSPKFELVESFKAKALIVTFWYKQDLFKAETRFKNDGSDKLSVNGIAQNIPSFDFDIIGLTNTRVQFELAYVDLDGKHHMLTAKNDSVNPF